MVDREPVPLNMLYYDYIGKVSTLADKLRLPYKGIEIWSEDRGHKANNNDPSMTKVADAFTRILEDIPAAGNKLDGGAFISVQEVDAALQKLQVEAALHSQESANFLDSPILANGHDLALDHAFSDMFNAT